MLDPGINSWVTSVTRGAILTLPANIGLTEPGDPDLETARSVVVITTGVANFPDWTFLAQWLAAGCTLWEDVVPAIEARIRAIRERDPTWYPRNLGCFDKAVRQARRRRVVEAFAATTDAPSMDGGERAALEPACVWCRVAFRPRGAGGKKRFCSDRCRAAFHRGCRVWAMRAVDEGRLSLEVIRDASKKPYTDFLEASPIPGVEK
jgi:hypothetical protein